MNKPVFPKINRPWLKNYDPHIPEDIYYPRTNLVRLFENTARKYPTKIFLTSKEYTFSFDCVRNLVDNLTTSLIHHGLKKGIVLP